MPRYRHKFVWALAVMCLMCGCEATPKDQRKASLIRPASDVSKTTAIQVQQATLAFADRFIPALAEGCDEMERNATSPEARIAAKGRKIGGSLAAMKNAVQTNPYAGLLDMVVMVTLLRDTADNPMLVKLYGSAATRMSEALDAQHKDVWNIAATFFTEAQLQELSQSVEAWREAHAGSNYVSFVRLNDFPETKQIAGDDSRRRPNSVFGLLFLDPLSNLDPAVREFELSRQLVERIFYYFQRMPLVISWQTDQLYAEMLSAPEVRSTLAETTRFVDGTARFADATDRFAKSIERFRADFAQNRKDAVSDLEAATARQRDAAIRQATTQVSAASDAAIKTLTASLGVEQERIIRTLHGTADESIDRLYNKAWRLIAIAVGAAFAAAVLFRLLFRPRPAAANAHAPTSASSRTTERASAR